MVVLAGERLAYRHRLPGLAAEFVALVGFAEFVGEFPEIAGDIPGKLRETDNDTLEEDRDSQEAGMRTDYRGLDSMESRLRGLGNSARIK
jgi:hypothetical protein